MHENMIYGRGALQLEFGADIMAGDLAWVLEMGYTQQSVIQI
jgi:hypothetical protein